GVVGGAPEEAEGVGVVALAVLFQAEQAVTQVGMGGQEACAHHHRVFGRILEGRRGVRRRQHQRRAGDQEQRRQQQAQAGGRGGDHGACRGYGGARVPAPPRRRRGRRGGRGADAAQASAAAGVAALDGATGADVTVEEREHLRVQLQVVLFLVE